MPPTMAPSGAMLWCIEQLQDRRMKAQTTKGTSPGRLRVLVADDHPLIIEGLTLTLSRLGMEVAGSCTVADEVLSAYAKAKPDVVVLDVRFTGGASGLEVATALL